MKPRRSQSMEATWTHQDSLRCVEKIRTCGAIVVDQLPFAKRIIEAGTGAGLILAYTPEAHQFKVHPVRAGMDPRSE